jgi:hypothetical protein
MSAHHELELDDGYISSCDTSRAGSDKPVHMALSYGAMTFTGRKERRQPNEPLSDADTHGIFWKMIGGR